MSYEKYFKDNPEFLNDYLNYKDFVERCSEQSVEQTYFDLKAFLKFIKLTTADRDPNSNIIKFKALTQLSSQYKTDYDVDISMELYENISIQDMKLSDMELVITSDIIKFIIFLNKQKNNGSRAMNRKLTSINGLFKYLTENELISSNPTLNIERPKIEKRIPKYLSLDQSKTLLSKAANSNSRNLNRNYLMLVLFLNDGTRLSELVKINISDIRLDDKTIKIYTKGGNEKLIYINDSTKEALEMYLKERTKITDEFEDKDALFLSQLKRRISKREVQYIVCNSIAMIENKKLDGLHTHSLRHTSATLYYKVNKADVKTLQRFLGHKNVGTTEIYLHFDNRELKEIMQKYSVSSLIERKLENEV